MKVLRFMQLQIAKAFWDAACAHKPMDPDLPRIILRRQEVRDELKKLWD